MVKQIMNKLFLSCLKATELIEKKFHLELSFVEKMQLKAHKMMCVACKAYEKQSSIIEKGLQINHKALPDETEIKQLKNQISIKLQKSNK